MLIIHETVQLRANSSDVVNEWNYSSQKLGFHKDDLLLQSKELYPPGIPFFRGRNSERVDPRGEAVRARARGEVK
jgi:hypothetical protein